MIQLIIDNDFIFFIRMNKQQLNLRQNWIKNPKSE